MRAILLSVLPAPFLGVTAACLLCASSAVAQMASFGGRATEYKNYDVRELAPAAPGGTVNPARATYRASQLKGQRADAVAARVAGMARARAGLRDAMPSLQVEDSRFGTTVPEVVGTGSATQFLTPDSNATHEQTLRGFLADRADLYGLTPAEAAGLVKFSDYANPAGNLSWVGLRQELNGLPVFQGELLAAFTGAGALARTSGNLAVGLEAADLPTTAALPPAQAVARAAVGVGRTPKAGSLTLNSTEANGRINYVSAGPFTQETKTELLYFPLEPGVATLAYAMVLWDVPRAYYVVVDANDGTLLFRKCITQDQAQEVTYNVYTGDSPSPLSPTTALPGQGIQATGVSRQNISLVADDLTASPLGWITDSASGATVTTTGNNCDAGLDAVSPDGIDVSTSTATYNSRPTTTNRSFVFTYNPPPLGTDSATNYTTSGSVNTLTAQAAGTVTNLFFWTNRYHDRLYNLGFTEQARNFQKLNTFTINGTTINRGGSANDPVLAQVHDYGGTNNANFYTPPDGTSGRMQMYIFNTPTPTRDGSLDGDVFLHEMTHGLSNRLHANGSGLASNQAGGMGEGWSDYYARCILSTADEDVSGIYASGGYVTYKYGNSTDNYYYGIRRFPYAVISNVGSNGKPHNPETFADVDPAQINLGDGAYAPNPLFGAGSATEVHNIGEIWCSMLLEMRARLVSRLGYATGNQRAMQIVTDAMKLDVASPNMVQARDSIIAADNAGYAGADVLDIRRAFAVRGMGAGASTNGTNVVESFAPELALGNVTFSDSLGNGNGIAEPGEDLLITVPLTNVGTVAETATASIGNYTASYNLAAGNGTATQVIPYRVPATTALGSTLTVPIFYTGLYGIYKASLTTTVGSPVYSAAFAQTFDGVTVPALPTGWTTTTETATNGTAGTAWKTVSSPVVDSANSAYTPSLAGNNTAGGGASLISSAATLPSSGPLQLTFKHTYATEGGFDGCVLEISVAGGAFTDIVTAGGSFATGGYNSTLQTSYGNPLAGRNAWSGTATAASVFVNLPASAFGKSVQFRWRLGFDDSVTVSNNGWYVDTIRLATGYSAAPIDTDGDGLQDGYERANGLNPNDPGDADKDSDGDGVSNLQEYLAGTNPQSAASVLKVAQATRDNASNFTLVFPSVMGKVYTYDYKNLLTDSAWTSPGATYNGTGGNLTLVFSPGDLGGQSARFFRIRVVPQ